jgi:hypothetical protein
MSAAAIVRITPPTSQFREVLTGVRTYFVRTDGSDSNTGLVNSAGGAFLTIQRAVNVSLTIDIGGFGVTISVAAGTYAAGFLLSSSFVGGNVTVSGDTTTPSNVLISNAANAFEVSGPGVSILVQGFKVASTTAGSIGCYAHDMGKLTINGKMEFGALTSGSHITTSKGGQIAVGTAYTISGGTNTHLNAGGAGQIIANVLTITLTGTPAFGIAFAQSQGVSSIQLIANTYVGSATGVRYNVTGNGIIDTSGAGATALPGNAAGTTSTGGQYN